MSRPIFDTGKDYQKKTATWVRQRVADRQGRCFLDNGDQSGVILADGVGMGKTWEALAASVLIIYGLRLRKRKGRILIVCPPNLITKWEDELSTSSDFRNRLSKWVRLHNTRTAIIIEETLASVVPVRRSAHVKTTKKYGKRKIESGTYIVSHGLLQKNGTCLKAICNQKWDVIIIDEAHQIKARKALINVDDKSDGKRCKHKILLSATPFQLNPKEWNDLAHLIVDGKTILKHPEVKVYLKAVDERFKSHKANGPTKQQVRDAENILKKVVARTFPIKSNRTYSMLLPDGETKEIQGRIDELDDETIQNIFQYIEAHYELGDIVNNFEKAYLKYRYNLATNEDRTFVATRLRRFLSKGEPKATSPRLEMLRRWSKHTWVSDLNDTIKDGYPRKTIIFTTWVGHRDEGEAESLRKLLSITFNDALQDVRSKNCNNWDIWQRKGAYWIRNLKLKIPETVKYSAWEKCRDQLPIILDRLANDELCSVIAGAQKRFRQSFHNQIQKQLIAIETAWHDYTKSESRNSYEGLGARRRLNDALRVFERWGEKHGLRNVERYTGNENRSALDRVAAGFREVMQPWVLVASNVGAEGIDLQTYTRRIVHYDLEWNPARMEQREGRGDRVGRLLREELAILYCLVPRTYDERMFHQFVARDRWHGVLLGKGGAKLAEDDHNQHVRLEAAKFIKKVRLNLSPKK